MSGSPPGGLVALAAVNCHNLDIKDFLAACLPLAAVRAASWSGSGYAGASPSAACRPHAAADAGQAPARTGVSTAG